MSKWTRSSRGPLRHMQPLRLCAALALCGAVLGAGAFAQDGEKPKDDEREKAPDLTRGLEPSSPQEELMRLFSQVERSLRATDTMLWEAGAGEIPLGQPEDSGLADLLREAQSSGREALGAIDQILEIAQQQSQSQSSSSSSQQQQQQQQSPSQQQQNDGQPQGQRENTPEAEQQPEDQQEGQEQEQQGGEEPKDGQEQPDPEDENQANSMREEQTGPRSVPGADADRWGELPQRVREIFRTEGGGEMPAQYRSWIDAYYRRLNRGR